MKLIANKSNNTLRVDTTTAELAQLQACLDLHAATLRASRASALHAGDTDTAKRLDEKLQQMNRLSTDMSTILGL